MVSLHGAIKDCYDPSPIHLHLVFSTKVKAKRTNESVRQSISSTIQLLHRQFRQTSKTVSCGDCRKLITIYRQKNRNKQFSLIIPGWSSVTAIWVHLQVTAVNRINVFVTWYDLSSIYNVLYVRKVIGLRCHRIASRRNWSNQLHGHWSIQTGGDGLIQLSVRGIQPVMLIYLFCDPHPSSKLQFYISVANFSWLWRIFHRTQ